MVRAAGLATQQTDSMQRPMTVASSAEGRVAAATHLPFWPRRSARLARPTAPAAGSVCRVRDLAAWSSSGCCPSPCTGRQAGGQAGRQAGGQVEGRVGRLEVVAGAVH